MSEEVSRSRSRGGAHNVSNHEVFHLAPGSGLPSATDTPTEMTVVGLRDPIPTTAPLANGARPSTFIHIVDSKQLASNGGGSSGGGGGGGQSKTPVSVLQETLSRKGLTPKYELLQEEGAIHEPTFRYRVTVADIIATGTGRSKKEAKHSAAKSLLNKIKGSTNDAFSIPDAPPKKEADENQVNPIGQLQELCMSRRWPPPSYLTEKEEGLPHERQFTIACKVIRYKETGTGKSKKVAKRLAAQKMLTFLQGVPCEDNSANFGFDDEDELVQRLSQSDLGDMKGRNISQSLKVAQFHKNLRNSKGVKLCELQTMKFSNHQDFSKILTEIAEEQNFSVTYVDIEEKCVSGKRQCLIQLSTIPVAVCCGTGKNEKEAQNLAALSALGYLRHMNKPSPTEQQS